VRARAKPGLASFREAVATRATALTSLPTVKSLVRGIGRYVSNSDNQVNTLPIPLKRRLPGRLFSYVGKRTYGSLPEPIPPFAHAVA